MKLYRLYDCKAEYWLGLSAHRTDADAVRSFTKAVKPGAQFDEHAEDFSMWFVGEDDEFTGNITPAEPKKMIAEGILLKQAIGQEEE